ncbi:MAG: clostripain-related cysteine peptidase [Candidatus Cloacimonetes bacterium]|nr:clostripain-related cysteine peptidase [Candidatus Cloacimonadota bacterium]
MKKISLLLFLLMLVPALFAEDWTVLIYMGADNDLSGQAIENLQAMEAVEQPHNLNLIVQLDLPGSGAKRHKIEHNPEAGFNSRIVQSLGNVDSGDPEVLRDFVSWGFKHYPASRRMLIIWSHADSWYKQSKYISPDEESGNAIGVANGELSAALSGTPSLDILLFDACSMQSIEIGYELRHFADYIVGSADLVPVNGFPYQTMIPLFSQEPRAVAAQIPDLYLESYLPGSQNNPSNYFLNISCSVIDTSVLGSYYNLLSDYWRNLYPHAAQLMKIRDSLYEMNSGYADVDVNQMLSRIIENGILPEMSAEVWEFYEQLVPYNVFSTTYYQQNLGALAIWFPDVRYNLNIAWSTYMKLAFAQSSWLSLVNAALGNDQDAPSAPKLIRQYQYHGRLHLAIEAPADVDSLCYHIQGDHADFWLYSQIYAQEIHVDFEIGSSGNCGVYAVDQSGNTSVALSIDYQYETPKESLVVRPNPVSTNSPAFLDWYLAVDSIAESKIYVYNLKGQRILSFDHDPSAKSSGIILLQDIPGFDSLIRGVYIVEYSATGKRLRVKFSIL